MGSEVGVADVDVGRLDGDAHFPALVDVLDHVVGAAGNRGQQRCHELYRIMSLQICRVVGQQRVCRGVRLVKAILGELLHQVEDLLDLLRRVTALHRALHEALRAAAPSLQVSFCPWRGAAGRLHLASSPRAGWRFALPAPGRRSPPSAFQDFLQLGEFILDSLAPVFAIDEMVDHAALDRSRTVERIQGREVFDRVGW